MTMRNDGGVGPSPGEDLARSLELVRLAKQGDRPSLEELLARYQDRVRRIVRLQLTGEPRRLLDTMDVVQETFVVAMRRIQDFEPKSHGSIIQWLVTIAEHKIKDERVKRKPVLLDPGPEDSSGGGHEPVGNELTPSQVVGARELKEIYDECVQELPEAQREVVIWRDYGLFTWNEIHEKIGTPTVHAAQQLYQRASEHLEQRLRRRHPEL